MATITNRETLEIRTLRVMAWERAKGELRGVLNSYWGNDNYEAMQKAVDEFIEKVESDELQV